MKVIYGYFCFQIRPKWSLISGIEANSISASLTPNLSSINSQRSDCPPHSLKVMIFQSVILKYKDIKDKRSYHKPAYHVHREIA